MSNLTIDEKLDRIEPRIKENDFLHGSGGANEVSYYIFDYEPEYELKVRDTISNLKHKINDSGMYSFKIVEFDLFNIMFEILEEKGFKDKVFKFEEKKGRDYTKNAIEKSLRLTSDSNLIVKYICDRTPDNCVVFLTGVGKAYPILRSHNVLNNLHQVLDRVPVVLFFPGTYSGTDLSLFNTLEHKNYYRAFPLVR